MTYLYRGEEYETRLELIRAICERLEEDELREVDYSRLDESFADLD